MMLRSAFPRRLRLALALLTGIAVLTDVAPADAQTAPRLSDGVVTPAKNVSSADDASAIYLNPANLALMPGPEARFTLIHTGDDSPIANRGYALDLALPFWVFATGLRIDWLNPPAAAPPPFSNNGLGHRYQWVRWGSAMRLGQLAAIGATLAWSHAHAPDLDGYFSATGGLTVRPNRFVSAAVVARDFNTPTNDIGRSIQPSFDLGLALRPVLGRRLLEIGGTGSYRGADQRWVPSAHVAVDVPYVGRLRLGATLPNTSVPEVLATAALDLNLDRLQVTAGSVFGNAVTRSGTGVVLGAALRTFRESPHLPAPARVVRLRFETTPDLRQHVRLLHTLWRLADDDDVAGVLLELRARPATSLARSEELVDAISLLRAHGKKVLCHLEDAQGRELFVCSAADRIAVNPAGGLRFAGLSSRYFYFGGLLGKLGVRADFVRIGRHKLAPEQLTGGPSETARRDHRDLLDTIEGVYLDQIARGRHMSRRAAQQAIAAGPFIATEARDAGLVDALVYDDEIDRFVEEALGRPVRVVDWSSPTAAPRYWRKPPKIAVIYLQGDMIDGQSRRIPLIDLRLAGSYTIAKALKQAREDPSVKAVVFRIETGGGSSLAADVILREATLTARAKPLVVSMGSTAASGGYYASVAAAEIFANRATITGSIGIFYGKVDVVGLLHKLGVHTEAMRSAPRADAESLFRPFTERERQELGKKVKQFYDLFVGRVAEGRKLSPRRVHAIAQGRVWTGDQAKARGLVDHIGGLRQALAQARKLASLSDDTPIVELPTEEPTLIQMVLEAVGVPTLGGKATMAWVPPPLMDVARALVPFTVYQPYKPLAHIELMVSNP